MTTDPNNDAALLAQFAKGDAGAARWLTRRHTARLMGLALRMAPSRAAAEDLVQETMLRLWRYAPNWKSSGSVTAWTNQVLRNLAIDEARKSARHQTDGLDGIDPADPTPDAAQQMLQTGRRAALRAALAELPPRQAQAFVARHLDGTSNMDIAKDMDLSVDAVESLIARAKRHIAAALAPQKPELGFQDD